MKSELLLPVGNETMLLAAIHHGADAVYFGVPYFNARGRTTDFSFEEVKQMIDLAHLYGVKVNMAINVVIFQEEIPRVLKILERIIALGPDAFIVQDLGLASLIRSMAPHQRIHASTQMTVTNPDAIRLLEDLSIDRFVLGRENSLAEIELIRAETQKELEVFVHGALCVAYSGQCFTSESIGGRSANRGQCAQSCRLSYDLYVDGVQKYMGDKKYLVSPKDLMGLAEVPRLKEIGVNSFKVEGRLKTPEYVAAAAKNYRAVMDGEDLNISERSRELNVTYSRGFFNGWFDGVNHQELVDGTYSAHRGMKLGKVVEVKKQSFVLKTQDELHAGAGLLIAGENEIGSKIFSVKKIPQGYEIELVQKKLPIRVNDTVYLNSDERVQIQLQKTWTSREGQKRIPVKFWVEAKIQHKLNVSMMDDSGTVVQASSSLDLDSASNRALTLEFIGEELASLGGSIYECSEVMGEVDDSVFIPQKEIKELRKILVQKMNEKRIFVKPVALDINNIVMHKKRESTSTLCVLNILLRNKTQVEGFVAAFSQSYFHQCEHLIGYVILDFEFGKDYAPSVELLKNCGLKTAVATTRILKPKEYYNLKNILRIAPDKILVRNLGALEYLKREGSIPLMGDFSLNMTNSYTYEYLLSKGLDSICCSYDLNQAQLFDLMDYAGGEKLEVTLHQYMPEFHMEHCVFAACLSTGSSFRDCGKPCEKHDVKLKDVYGNWHYLKADQECRNTFYKATPQSASFLLTDLKRKNLGAVRIEALNESAQEICKKVQVYLKLMQGELTEDEALSHLKIQETYGLGSGQLNKADDYKNRKNLTSK
jgi:putative protease